MRFKIAGVWDLDKLEYEYYSDGNLDSSGVQEDFGVWLIEDNESDVYNILTYIQSYSPKGLREVTEPSGENYGAGAVYWHLDRVETDRFSIWASGPILDYFNIYNIRSIKQNKIELEYIIPDPNDGHKIGYKELLTLKRQ